jgi:polyhydroxyalkanoate synthesis regulator phasin
MELNDFLLSPIREVKDLAECAQNIENLYTKGELTKEEAAELLADLLKLKDINTEMVDIETQRELWQLVKLLQTMKFFTSL